MDLGGHSREELDRILRPLLAGEHEQHQVHPGQRGYMRTGLKEINMWPVVADEHAPYYFGQNAPLAPVPAHVIQTGTSTDQEYKDSFQVLEHVDENDLGYIVETHNFEVDPLEDYTMIDKNDSDEDDQVDGKSFDQNIMSELGTDEVELTTLSEKRRQQDFSPPATTPNDISVTKLTTSSFEPLQKSEKVEESKRESQSASLDPIMGTESVIQTGDGANIVAVHDEDKEDEMNGGIVLDKMKKMVEGGTNKFSSTFGVVTDKVALAGLVPMMSLVDHGDGSGPTLTSTLELHVAGQTKQM